MHFYKLIKSLQALDSVQIKSLDKYVRSPYFGVYMPSVLLFEHMASLHPRFPNRKITFEAIAQLGESLNTLKRQETAATRLMRSIENFIAQEEWQKKEGEVNRYRMRGYKALRLETEFDKAFEKEMKRLKEDPEQDIDVFSERHLLTEISVNGFRAKLNRNIGNNLMPIIQTLDEFYAVKKLRYLCEAKSRKQAIGASFEEQQIIALIELLKPYTNEQHPYVFLFVNAYKLLHAPNYQECQRYYNSIKEYANAYKGHKVPQSLREVVGYAINSSLSWFNAGYEGAGEEYLWWIAWKMKNNLLLENGKLMPVTFRNIINLSVDAQTPEWLDDTINFYGCYLPDEYQETYLSFARGIYQYKIRNYKKAVRYFLLAQEKEEVVLNCIVRRWQWICNCEYDKSDTEGLTNQLLSFEKYVHRNRNEIKHVIRMYELFIDFAKRLLNCSTAKDFAVEFEKIQQEGHFSGKQWLEQQFVKEKNQVRKKGLQT